MWRSIAIEKSTYSRDVYVNVLQIRQRWFYLKYNELEERPFGTISVKTIYRLVYQHNAFKYQPVIWIYIFFFRTNDLFHNIHTSAYRCYLQQAVTSTIPSSKFSSTIRLAYIIFDAENRSTKLWLQIGFRQVCQINLKT